MPRMRLVLLDGHALIRLVMVCAAAEDDRGIRWRQHLLGAARGAVSVPTRPSLDCLFVVLVIAWRAALVRCSSPPGILKADARPHDAAHGMACLPCLTLLRILTCFLIQGYLFGLLSAFLSALAAVYTEWVMKRNNDSLYWQASFVLGRCAPSP